MIGRRIKQRRKQLGHSLEVAGRYLGVSAQAVRLWEQGANRPKVEHYRRIAAYLETTPEVLVSEAFRGAASIGSMVGVFVSLAAFWMLPAGYKFFTPIIHQPLTCSSQDSPR